MEHTIKSPMPGIFYRRSNPDAAPYVNEGDKVTPGDAVGLVEIMKNFYEVTSHVSGVVARFLVEDGAYVEAEHELLVVAEAT
jgi:acetyl-CoA carboxylase biotin carboxyl carrier protein